jgi:hypothetical protein
MKKHSPLTYASALALLRTVSTAPAATVGTTTIRLLQDSNGGFWIPVKVPVPANVMQELRLQEQQGQVVLDVRPLPEDEFRSTEMKWLQGNHAMLSEKYAGQWLAIEGDALVAHGPDLATVVRLAQEAGFPHPFITAIPGKPVTLFIG